VWNLYGPTETTIWSTGYKVTNGREPVLIGRPIANTQCYLLDGQGQPVPVGVTGELHIGGDGLARGYLNRPELTAEKFVHDPFRGGKARMYRTGDLARYRPDGNIECLGRIDHQVKIRGYRIELGEIEARLIEHPAVREAVVIAREDTPGDKRLVAYYTASPAGASGEQTAGAEQFRPHLSTSLPEYMIPAAYVRLESLPLTPNGKLDRKALPAPEADSYTTTGYEPPEGETEIKLAGIWEKVLKLERIGRHDHFFDLGGHSLMAARAVSLMNSEFGTTLPVRVLFQANTVSQLASVIGKRGAIPGEVWPSLIPIQTHGSRPPLFCVARPNVNALGYLMLSRELGNDQPIYGLQVQLEVGDPDLEFSEEQFRTTAAEYIRALKTVQPQGPYNLIGQCQGAYIAFEMVRLLEEAGEKVVFLGILDAWAEENTRHKWLFYADLVYWRLRSLDGSLIEKTFESVRSRLLGRKTPDGSTMPSAMDRRLRRKMLMQRYFPGKDFVSPVCSCPITVFRVKKQFWYRKNDEKMGWGSRTRMGVKVRTVPGDHLTMTRQPHIRELAAMITEHLDEVAPRPVELNLSDNREHVDSTR
jgi:thioesterase domain-containing protein/acyl carrier protein